MRLMISCRAIDNMAGGVERQAIALANEMAARGHDVSLLTFDREGAIAFYDINEEVHWSKLGMGDPTVRAGWLLRFKRMAKVRSIMRDFKPDVVLAFQDGMFTTLFLYTLGIRIPIIAAERETPHRYDYVKYCKPRSFTFALYRFAHSITVQCESYVSSYATALQKKMVVIPNSVYPAAKYAAPRGKNEKHKIILCVGRLTYQKNQLVLLEAFSQLHEKYPNWRVQLVGAGDRDMQIKQKVEELCIADKVEFLGAVHNIEDYYAGAHLLCIPSYWEGFPNVLAEGLAHGLPAIGYEECGGIKDLIEHKANGLIAEGNNNMESLKVALDTMMGDDEMRKDMGRSAIESVKQYAPDVVYDKWENFLKGV
jgi:glycosyltransferase involved in cell wall biosynthesis